MSSSVDRNGSGIDAAFVHIPRGKAQVASDTRHVLGMHLGRPVQADCTVGHQRARVLQKPGDMDFIPPGVDGSWEDDAECQILPYRSIRCLWLGR